MMDIMPLFKALADEKRIKIVALLATRALAVQEIAAAVDLTPARVSHHLTVLRAAGPLRQPTSSIMLSIAFTRNRCSMP